MEKDTTLEVGSKPVLELKTKEYVDYGITSFAQFDAAKEAKEAANEVMSLSDTFMNLVYNITYSNPDAVPNKKQALMSVLDEFTQRLSGDGMGENGIKREGRKKYLRSDYLLNQSDNSDAWQWLLVKQSGKFDLDQVNLAVDLLQKELLPNMNGSDLLVAKARLRSIYNDLGVVAEQQPNFVKELPSLFLWKESGEGGTAPLRWMMIYSNNSLDQDVTEPNLFKERSHKAFAELANAGVLPMPEAWVWHVPGSRWGVAEHVMVLEGEDGFCLPVALGVVDAGCEGIAENLFKEKSLLVSHGTPRKLILYDETDKRLIDFAPTIEISPLPKQRAANNLTAFVG